MKTPVLFAAVLLAACAARDHTALENSLLEAQTAARLSAEHTRKLEQTYSDIYFALDSLTPESFAERVAAGNTVYAYIGRPSCGDCNAFEPVFKRHIRSRNLRGKIYFVNVHRLHQDKAAWAAFRQTYGLAGTPVLAKYSKGRLNNKLDWEENGGISDEDLQQWLDKNRL